MQCANILEVAAAGGGGSGGDSISEYVHFYQNLLYIHLEAAFFNVEYL